MQAYIYIKKNLIQNHETGPLQGTTNAFKVQTLFREYGNPSRTQPSLLREKFATFQETSTVSNIECLVQGIADYHNLHQLKVSQFQNVFVVYSILPKNELENFDFCHGLLGQKFLFLI